MSMMRRPAGQVNIDDRLVRLLPTPAWASRAKISFKAMPPRAAPPICRKPRREMPSQNLACLSGRPRIFNMAGSFPNLEVWELEPARVFSSYSYDASKSMDLFDPVSIRIPDRQRETSSTTDGTDNTGKKSRFFVLIRLIGAIRGFRTGAF